MSELTSSSHEHVKRLGSFRVDENNEHIEWLHYRCEDPTCIWSWTYHSPLTSCSEQALQNSDLTDADFQYYTPKPGRDDPSKRYDEGQADLFDKQEN